MTAFIKKRILLSFIFISLFIFLAANSVSLHALPAGHAEISDAGKYLKEHVVHKRLANGINVLMLDRGYTPTLALLISFRVGSVDESYRTMGMAHMLEHMLFKGTCEIGTRDYKKEKIILGKIEETGEKLDRLRLSNPENNRIICLEKQLRDLQKEHRKFVISSPYSKIYTQSGGVGFNASTSRDRTTYYVELPVSKFEIWADLESKRIVGPVMREFYLERNAVLEERLMRYESSGTGALFEKFAAAAYIAHPYRHPTIGWKSNIKHYSIRELRDFYSKNYIPSRMTITVVGRLKTDKMLAVLEKYFGRLKAMDEPSPMPVKEPEQKGERRFDFLFESNPYILIGWHKPSVPSREDYIFDIISGVLSDGKTSRFYRSLVLEKGIVSSIDAWNGFPGARYDNLFVVAVKPKSPASPEQIEQIEMVVYEEINKLEQDLKQKEINKVLSRMESSFIFGLDSNMGLARQLSYYQTVFDDWTYITDYMNKLKSVSLSEIKEAIRKYLTESNRTVGILRDSRAVKQ